MKNQRIRKAMFVACMTQGELAKLLGETDSAISVILNRYELSRAEQDDIVRKIKESTP